MANAGVRWDPGDSAGQRTLDCVVSNGRWNRWKILPATIGERATAVGDGRLYQWSHRTDYAAAMELTIAYSDMALAVEFLIWANAGNEFSIDTGDADDTSYEECQVAPGTLAEVSAPDPETLDLTLSLTALNIAVSPTALICQY